jgi:hypothetical protein
MKKSPSKQELIEMANQKWMPEKKTDDKLTDISERLLGMDPNFTFKNNDVDDYSRQNGYDNSHNAKSNHSTNNSNRHS